MKFIPVANPYIGEEEAKAVFEVVKNGWVSMGKKVEEFEKLFAKYTGAKYAVAVNNGTTALHLGLLASGIKDGDEVLVPDITFISTGNVCLYERATPVLVECDPKTYNISLEDAQKRITKKTRAIIAVDMNGLPVDYDSVAAFAKKHGLKIIADSAESLGAVYKGKRVGAIAPMHIFSFFPNKNVTTGEGGMITTDDETTAVLLRQLRNQGQEGRYNHIHLGYNYRMTDVTASIGVEQMRKLDKIISEKEKIAKRYNKTFENDGYISAPFVPPYADQHSWYMYAVSVKEGVDRDKVCDELKKCGIETRLSFPPIHIQPYYQKKFGYKNSSYPVSLRAWQQLIDIPMWLGLGEAEQDYVIEKLKTLARKFAKQ